MPTLNARYPKSKGILLFYSLSQEWDWQINDSTQCRRGDLNTHMVSEWAITAPPCPLKQTLIVFSFFFNSLWLFYRLYVMQSSKMSLKSIKLNFPFSDWLCNLFAKLPFTTDPIEIGQLVIKVRAIEGLQKQQET